ncbi:aspartyl/asparaginyl beta-hydroxylase domain-containing protein [Nocardia sp. NPDC006044]|uniref:aspartyl/asparaginyl beta-hydroxylase domain-containing protein n=1 Tax=Nocardia sp. NPDC006044 TaxID=3364306 RepID=UPI0036C36193
MRSHIIARIDLDEDRLASDLDYLAGVPRVEEKYDEFSSGYWKNISLANSSGLTDDTEYRDIEGAAITTDHGRKTTYLTELVESVFDRNRVKMVRARNLIDAMVLPHRDFVELERDNDNYFRTFMVLEDNPEAFHSDSDHVFRMRPGELWYLDAAAVHSAVNFSTVSRQSICVDFVLDADRDEAAIFRERGTYDRDAQPEIRQRRTFTGAHEQRLLGLTPVVDRRNFKDILFLLAKVHFDYEVPAEKTYEWLLRICEGTGDKYLAAKAAEISEYMVDARALGERFSINDWALTG